MFAIDIELNQQIVDDIKIINEKIMPDIAEALYENKIDIISSTFYFAGAVKNMLEEMSQDENIENFEAIKELVLRYMLD